MKTPSQTKTTDAPHAPAADVAAHEDGERTPRPTILLAEDDRSIRRYLEVILQKAGYTVMTASDGLEAMKIALTTPVDAVVTDAIMPHLGGHELCRFLRHQSRLAHLPIILLSGIETNAPATEKEDGANVYLSKPVTPVELINCLERLL